jgi:hypothetical protein
MPIRIIALALSLASLLLLPAVGFGEQANTLTIPKGANVEVQGTTARVTGGGGAGPGASGTWACTCRHPLPQKSGCMVLRTSGTLTCGPGGDKPCPTQCAFTSTQGRAGAAGAGARPSAPAGVGTR